MDRFNIDNLISCINNVLNKCNDRDEEKAIKNVAKNFEWEFESYCSGD